AARAYTTCVRASRLGLVGRVGRVGTFLTCLTYLTYPTHPTYLTHAAVAQQAVPFQLEETTIAQIQSTLRTGSLTCRTLVDRYLARIEAYDKKGPSLNAIVLVNPDATR